MNPSLHDAKQFAPDDAEVLKWRPASTDETDQHVGFVLCELPGKFVVWLANHAQRKTFSGDYFDYGTFGDTVIERDDALERANDRYRRRVW